MKDGIDFVEGQPIFDLALVTLKNCPHIVIVKIYHLVIGPAVVLAGQMQRLFIMGNGDQWLHAILVAGSKEPVIKGQPLLIGLLFISFGEDAAPGNGCAENLKAHFREQLDIFLITMIKINAFKLQIICRRLLFGGRFQPLGQDILNGKPLAFLIISSFALIGGYSTAP